MAAAGRNRSGPTIADILAHGEARGGRGREAIRAIASMLAALGKASYLYTAFARVIRSAYRIGGSGSVVERLLAKEKVAGSNPVFRSIYDDSKRLRNGAVFACALPLGPGGLSGGQQHNF